MDEIKEIRDLLPKQAPPSADVTTKAKDQLTDSPPRGRGRLLVAAAAAAAVVAGGVTVAVWPSEQAAPVEAQTVPGAAVPQTARDVLLLAAAKTEDATTAAGRFWRLRTMSAWMGPKVGTAPNTYTLEQRAVTEYWMAREDGGDWNGYRTLGARPATPTDQEAWQRAGSPTSWDQGPADTVNGEHLILSTAPDAGRVFRIDPGLPSLGGRFTAKELRELPTDKDALRDALAKREPTERGEDRVPGVWLRGAATDLLTAPVSSGVRAAAFRMLADLGGAESSGVVADKLGRKGTGINLTIAGTGGSTVVELIIDPANGQLLSQSTKSSDSDGKVQKQGYTVTLSAAWTDDAPAVPGLQIP